MPGSPEYLQELRALCDKTGALLIFDEVQCGMGRTGSLFAYMGYGVTPDVLTSAKALGNGFPVAAMLTTEELAKNLSVGTHGTTYGGNPLAATVALTVLETINQPAFLARVKEASLYLIGKLEELIRDYPQVFTTVRGAGLLLGLVVSDEFKGRSKDIQRAVEAEGLMVLIAGPDVVRMAPALIVTDAQIDEAMALMRKGVDALLAAK
jgi:acetylornithine/N-succinyldiaminopimelate aminotransferase